MKKFIFILAFIISHSAIARPIPKIAMIQMSPIVNDFDGTVARVIKFYNEAVAKGAKIVVTPELILPGYPPQDLLSDRPEVLSRSLEALEKIIKATEGKDTRLVIGHLDKNPDPNGRKIQNVASVIHNGKIIYRQVKALLPTYGPFDEMRYFEPGTESHVVVIDGVKVGILVCEDMWFEDDHDGRLIYKRDPMDQLLAEGAEIIISVSASPYTKSKRTYRHKIHAERARKAGVPIMWVNQIGATDHLPFDGSSFVLDKNGELVGAMRSFPKDEEVAYVTFTGDTKDKIQFERKIDPEIVVPGFDPELEVVFQALTTGMREYFHRNGQTKAVLGLSGGIDSTVSAALASFALGAENVTGISMPSKYSSGHGKSDAALLAKSLGINFFTIPIEKTVDDFRRYAEIIHTHTEKAETSTRTKLRNTLNKFIPRSWVSKFMGELSDGVADESLQARTRMIILYNFANQNPGTLVLTTGCKSELAMGWCTKFGDHAGDFNPVGDLFKTEEIEMGHYINARQKALGLPELIPAHILSKRASPELKPNQFTDQTLPPYSILDPLLGDYMDNGLSVTDLTVKYGKKLRDQQPWRSEFWVQEVIRRFDEAEQKRDVAAVLIKVSRRGFNQKIRRIPTAKMSERHAAPISCETAVAAIGGSDRRTARP